MSDGLKDIEAAHKGLKDWYDRQKSPSVLSYDLSNWTYDVENKDRHVPARQGAPIIFMGFNPGGGGKSKTNQAAPVKAISCSDENYVANRSERAWRTRCSRLARVEPHKIVFTELVVLPTDNQGGLKDHDLENLMKRSVALNQAIIKYHNPQVIFQTGITGHHLEMVKSLYGLQPFQNATSDKPGLFHSYTLNGIPWIAFKHFASFGFSAVHSKQIQDHADYMVTCLGRNS